MEQCHTCILHEHSPSPLTQCLGCRHYRLTCFQKSRKPLEVIFANGFDEAFHMLVDVPNDVVQRWGVVDNETLELQGEAGEGTTIDVEEPFVIT